MTVLQADDALTAEVRPTLIEEQLLGRHFHRTYVSSGSGGAAQQFDLSVLKQSSSSIWPDC